jgi:hypothetical protein
LPAALEVSIGCSVAFNEAPRILMVLTNVLKVPDAAGEAIDPGHHQHVTGHGGN